MLFKLSLFPCFFIFSSFSSTLLLLLYPPFFFFVFLLLTFSYSFIHIHSTSLLSNFFSSPCLLLPCYFFLLLSHCYFPFILSSLPLSSSHSFSSLIHSLYTSLISDFLFSPCLLPCYFFPLSPPRLLPFTPPLSSSASQSLFVFLPPLSHLCYAGLPPSHVRLTTSI